MIIKQILAREILDSRGFPTLEAEVVLSSGQRGRGCVPSGASTGSREALELRDQDKSRYMGKGVRQALANVVNKIAPKLIGEKVDQKHIDQLLIDLDGTENKQRLGANAILAVSLACAQAAALFNQQMLWEYLADLSLSKPCLPLPLFNIINGGMHADNDIDIQEFMIIPLGASNFESAIRYGAEVYHCLKHLLKQKGQPTQLADEGGFAPNLSTAAALDLLMMAIETAGFIAGRDIYLGLDVAASELYHEGKYHLASENKVLSSEQFIQEMSIWLKNYPIISLEDALDENDWPAWQALTQQWGSRVQLVGDDLFVTHSKLLKQGIDSQVANAILIKLNQIGTLSETLETIHLAKQANYNAIISHRSGETEDTFIADLAVATGVGQIKTGAPARGERTAKYNQLLRISEKVSFNRAAFQRWGVV